MTGEVVWRPSAERVRGAELTLYRDWLAATRGLVFPDYEALWQWSVGSLEDFWQSIWDWSGMVSPTPYAGVLDRRAMPGAKWFDGATLNYAAEVFRNGRLAEAATPGAPALVFRDETGDHPDVSWPELEARVASLAAALTAAGVVRGDRVVAYLPNVPETIVACLAVASIGAIWSVCAPDMGPVGVLDRFRQIEPVALIACDGYRYGGKTYDRTAIVAGLVAELPTLRTLVMVPLVDRTARGAAALRVAPHVEHVVDWADCIADDGATLSPAPLPFDHPLWIVYSSGTTGTPKAIVHGHGGAAIVGLKDTRLQLDVAPGRRFFWSSSSGWIMWNVQLSALLCGATVCIFDGNPGWPDLNALWRFADERRIAFFGAGAAFYASCLKAGVEPARDFDLSSVEALGSTGSPLSDDAYRWIYAHVKNDVWLAPMSGGTDLAASFTCGSPILPVRVGEMQCRALGAAVHAFDDAGRPLAGEVGELVCTAPIPSMPLFFWNDPGGRRLHESYYDMYPGVWRHGDWIRLVPRDEDDGTKTVGAIIYGRSDATINRHGIRMGTAELYRAVEALPEVLDSLVVDLEYLGRESWMPLFVVLRGGLLLDPPLVARIKGEIRTALSARHVPNDVFAVAAVPRTLSGKKLELPVKKLLMGQPLERVVNRDSMANPESMDWFVALAARRATEAVGG